MARSGFEPSSRTRDIVVPSPLETQEPLPTEGPDVPDPFSVQLASPADLDALVDLETRVFGTDRISRRSFRHFLKSPTALMLVAVEGERLVGYVLVLFRAGTARARLYSIAVTPEAQGRGVGVRLLEAAERAAYDHDRQFLRLEVREDNSSARRLYKRMGYHSVARIEEYYEDGCTALRLEKRLHGARSAQTAVPYYPQTTEFTCGPACLQMALAAFGHPEALDRPTEIRLWREATTIFLASGLGGCEPFGLAVVARRHGLFVELRLNTDDLFFLASVRDEDKRDVMRLVQEDFRSEADRLKIPVRKDALPAVELGALAAAGTLSIVLVSGYRMYRKKEPHWILVHGADTRHVIVHDPWLKTVTVPESVTDTAHLPIPFDAFDRMARWGAAGVRAQILVRKAEV